MQQHMVVNVESLRLFTNIILIYFERFLPKSSVVLVVTFFTVQQLVMGYKKMDFDLNYFILTVGKGALLPLGQGQHFFFFNQIFCIRCKYFFSSVKTTVPYVWYNILIMFIIYTYHSLLIYCMFIRCKERERMCKQ